MYNKLLMEILGITSERARLVEGYLRLQYGTLDSLSRERIKKEYKGRDGISVTIDADPKEADELARSYGL